MSASGAGPRSDAAAAAERVRRELSARLQAAASEGMAAGELRGQLSRPLLAYSVALARGEPTGDAFWHAALAVQLAHEASLVHDDVVDGADTRRGRPTVAAERGTAAALVLGDHLLTTAYRMAARTGSLPFVERFAAAVERTVAGELAQGRALGRVQGWDEYRAVAVGKAGELLGCALAAAPSVAGAAEAEAVAELGRRIGLFYQMLDDLLDYCPGARTGKAALGDFRQGRWTWPLLELPDVRPGADAVDEVAARLHAAGPDGTALRRCLARLAADADRLGAEAERLLGPCALLRGVLEDWLARAEQAVEREERARAQAAPGADAAGDRSDTSGTPRAPAAASAALRQRVPAGEDVVGYLAHHSRSFRFAVRFFPREQAERVARVYAYCRVTDDLVDRAEGLDLDAREALLDEWLALSRGAYAGAPSGVPLLDRVMGEMAGARVPFRYATELCEGMRMDLRGERYATLDALRVYTHRVASVVGLWITELFDVRQPLVLRRAAALGHAMQLTNILRDVGEDWRAGRLYLPADRMRRHGVDEAVLDAMVRGARRPDGAYRALVDELIEVAESDYEAAFRAIAYLPAHARRPVAVAAHVYRGIHGEIRRRGHDNLRLRAYTGGATKARLAARALWDLWRLDGEPRLQEGRTPALLGRGPVLETAPAVESVPERFA